MTEFKNSEAGHKTQIQSLTSYIYQFIVFFFMKHLQSESHKYSLYEKNTL